MGGIKERLIEDAKEIEMEKLGPHGKVTYSLLALKFEDGHSHIRYPEDDDQTHEFWKDIAEEKKFDVQVKVREVVREVIDGENGKEYKKDRKIVFGHHRSAGDSLMFSAGIRDFKLLFPEITIGVDNNQSWIWENNPYVDRSLKKTDPDVEHYNVGYPAIASVNNTYVHFTQMFLLDMIAIADLNYKLPISLGEFCSAFSNGEIGDPDLGNKAKNQNAREPFISIRNKYRDFGEKFCRMRGDLHMSDEERKYNLIKETYGIEKYWVIAPGGKRDGTAKIWDWRKFQEVIDHFDGRIKFVVIGTSDLLVEKLRNVIDLTDKFSNLRGLVPLVYHSEGCVSGPSLLLHLAAAVPPKRGRVRKPCVGILGGREPSAWTWYCTHQILHMNAAYSCCESGGCWYGRIHPLPKDPENNKNLCKLPIKSDGRTVQSCMEAISSEDVIRAIEKYYQGDLYTLEKKEKPITYETSTTTVSVPTTSVSSTISKEINILGNLNTAGGGEQSMLMIVKVLRRAGWKANVFPWGSVHKNYQNEELMPCSFINDKGEEMAKVMTSGIPLLFYGNDCVEDFVKYAEGIVARSSHLIVGINYTLGHLKDPRLSSWLSKTDKLQAVIFQNEEKRDEWDRQVVGFEKTKRYVMFGAIDIDAFYETCAIERENNGPLVVLKHCVADYRKYVTEESHNKGEKIHVWQKNMDKELDIKFYSRILKSTKNITFEFMEAHDELEKAFKNDQRMKFHKWDSMPVPEFLSRGHVYLYRTSNLWRDQYPRVVAEALAVGLPVLTEPRDGTKDRVVYGNTGFYFVDFDGCLYALKLLERKDKYRKQMGMYAKDWAKRNLDPRRWVNVVEEVISNGR